MKRKSVPGPALGLSLEGLVPDLVRGLDPDLVPNPNQDRNNAIAVPRLPRSNDDDPSREMPKQKAIGAFPHPARGYRHRPLCMIVMIETMMWI